jgi:hypothetical protein
VAFRAFNRAYRDDKLEYGEPFTDTKFKITDIAEIPNWQRILNKHASKVEGAVEKGGKRKRT